MKEDYSNAFFLLNQSHLMDKILKKGSGTSDQSLFRLQNKFRKTPLFVMYYLTKFDDVIYKVVFENSENYIHKVMQVSSWHHKLFHFIYPFESGKCGKEVRKLQKFEHLKNGKSPFYEIKNIFWSILKGLSFGEKIKIC